MSRKFLAMCLMFIVASSVVYEVQGTFLLKLYLARRIPRRCIGFTIFATKGMMMLVNSLEGGCPATIEFKEFFAKFKAFMTFISSVSVTSSQNVDVEMEDKANSLFNACSALEGANQKSTNVGDFKTTVMSMAKILIEQKKRGSMIMSFSQKRELVVSMVRWTRMIAQFVKSAAEMKGKSIDISAYGLDVDVNSSIKNEDSSSGSSDSEDSASTKTGSSASSGVSGKSSKTTSGDKFTDTTGSGSPTGNTSSSTSVSGETVAKGKTTASGNVSSKKKESGTSSTKTENESSGTSSRKSKGASEFKDTTGKTSGSPSGSPTSSPSGSASSSKTSVKGIQNASSSMNQESNTEAKKIKTSASKTTTSAATSVKQVESDTSKEVMSFISGLEKKYAGKSELKVFFDKLKTSMSASSKISSTNAQDFLSTMKSAAGKLSEAMIFVSSRFSKSEETKTSMESCQEQVMKTLKELQDINSQIVSGKTVTTTQQTELKQTITKWEQVTTQFVETAASSSSSSSSSQQISGGMTKTN